MALGYETKEEIIKWMVDTQLGRRNLTPIQKIAIAEKYRSVFENKAKENLKTNEGVFNGNQHTDKMVGLPILAKAPKTISTDTRNELSKIAGVSHGTYSKGVKILNSDDKEIKDKVEKGEMKINTAYFYAVRLCVI